jgi:isopentenyl phosphate kinase
MLTFVKFGGSVITDKSGREAADTATIATLATDLRTALAGDPTLRLILGHGSGSFGHYYAAQYGIHRGLAADADWMGFARTAGAALRLNRLVVDALLAADVPAISLQPSAGLHSNAGQLSKWLTEPLGHALNYRLIPVIHGDVAFDSTQGSAIISTEALFTYLALHSPFQPARIILVGEAAVFTADPRIDPNAAVIPQIDGRNIAEVLHGTGASHGADVTGGMRSKIELMWRLIQALPQLQVRLIGPHPDLLRRALLDESLNQGTLLKA